MSFVGALLAGMGLSTNGRPDRPVPSIAVGAAILSQPGSTGMADQNFLAGMGQGKSPDDPGTQIQFTHHEFPAIARR